MDVYPAEFGVDGLESEEWALLLFLECCCGDRLLPCVEKVVDVSLSLCDEGLGAEVELRSD